MKLAKYIMMASAPLLFASCLDTEPLGNYVTSDEKAETVEQNPDRLEASVTAITTNFSTFGAVRGSGVHAILVTLVSCSSWTQEVLIW